MDQFFRKAVVKQVLHVDFDLTLQVKGQFQWQLLPLLYYASSQTSMELGITTSRNQWASLVNMHGAFHDHGRPHRETLEFYIVQLKRHFGVSFSFVSVNQDVDVIDGYKKVLRSHERECLDELTSEPRGRYSKDFLRRFSREGVCQKPQQIQGVAKKYDCKQHVLIDDNLRVVKAFQDVFLPDVDVKVIQFDSRSLACIQEAAKAIGLEDLAVTTLRASDKYAECSVMEKIATTGYLLTAYDGLVRTDVGEVVSRAKNLLQEFDLAGDWEGLILYLKHVVQIGIEKLPQMTVRSTL